jgi:hypothetical protein
MASSDWPIAWWNLKGSNPLRPWRPLREELVYPCVLGALCARLLRLFVSCSRPGHCGM